MVFQIVPQPANRASGLETGEIDAVVDFYLPKADEPRLMQESGAAVPQGRQHPGDLLPDVQREATRCSPTRRRARRWPCAIDRKRLVTQVMNGLARPGYGAFGDGFRWMLDEADSYDRKYPLDPAHAKALLAQAGLQGRAGPARLRRGASAIARLGADHPREPARDRHGGEDRGARALGADGPACSPSAIST